MTGGHDDGDTVGLATLTAAKITARPGETGWVVPSDGSEFNTEERAFLTRYVSDPDGDVFALDRLPEVVKGALFARYSRYGGSLKRLLLDEFADDLGSDDSPARAEALYGRIFTEYGDDSVAQVGAAHVALENVSNLLTKRLEWGRLASYLEQSTRYIPFDTKVNGAYRYHRPAELAGTPHAATFATEIDAIFSLYSAAIPAVRAFVEEAYPPEPDVSPGVYARVAQAKTLDLLRGLLPAATTSNLGMFASGQAYENLLLRLRADELAESHDVAARLLRELRHVIPSFLTRVDREDRGVRWSEYLANRRDEVRALADTFLPAVAIDAAPLVQLVDYTPRDPRDAEVALATAALYPHVTVSEQQLHALVDAWPDAKRHAVIAAYVGQRDNRRHRPGRGLERIWYRFDVLGDYGGFRDLQRHRMMTIEWQPLTTAHGYETPEELEHAGVSGLWHEALERSDALYNRIAVDLPHVAPYAVCFAYRVRYSMHMNARAAMQMLELRSTPQGHPQYRTVVQEMHRLIRDEAGHTAIADAMQHVDHSSVALERLDAERAAEQRRQRNQGG
jgi:thymidylate synthase ThyX